MCAAHIILNQRVQPQKTESADEDLQKIIIKKKKKLLSFLHYYVWNGCCVITHKHYYASEFI